MGPSLRSCCLVGICLLLGCKDKPTGTPAPAGVSPERTTSGLVYTPLVIGSGASPGPNDKVKVHYRGTLADGSEFDSSYAREEPSRFPLGAVIECWSEGIQKMKAGGKARLVCPPGIAYGDRGAPPRIPPGATLTFEVELLEVL